MDTLAFYFGIYFTLLVHGLLTNVLGILLTVATFTLFQIRGVNPLKAMSYCSFFSGAAVAQWQLMIRTGYELVATIALVGTFSLIGLLSSLKFLRDEKLLIAIIVVTIGLAVLRFGGLPEQLVNWYARFYALVCLAAPVVVLAQAWYNPREPHGYG